MNFFRPGGMVNQNENCRSLEKKMRQAGGEHKGQTFCEGHLRVQHASARKKLDWGSAQHSTSSKQAGTRQNSPDFNFMPGSPPAPVTVTLPCRTPTICILRCPHRMLSRVSAWIFSTVKRGSFTKVQDLKRGPLEACALTSDGSKSSKSMLASDSATWSSRGLPLSPRRFQSKTRYVVSEFCWISKMTRPAPMAWKRQLGKKYQTSA